LLQLCASANQTLFRYSTKKQKHQLLQVLILSSGEANLTTGFILAQTKTSRHFTSFTSTLEAPASREFSISSFTTFTTEVMTWELDSSRTVSGGSCFMTPDIC